MAFGVVEELLLREARKLLTVQGDSLLASSRPMWPWLVTMLTLTCAGSVGTLPVLGGLAGLVAGSAEGGYWQLAPRSAVGLKAGSAAPDALGAALAVDPSLAEAFLWS